VYILTAQYRECVQVTDEIDNQKAEKLIGTIKRHCLRCSYSWTPRKAIIKRCPSGKDKDGNIKGCGSPYWNKPRQIRVKNPAKLRLSK